MKDEVDIYSKLYLKAFNELYTCMMNLRVELESIFAKTGQKYPKKFAGYDANGDINEDYWFEWGFELIYQLKWLQVFYRNNHNSVMYKHCHYTKPNVDLFRHIGYEVENPEYELSIWEGDREFLLFVLKAFDDNNTYPKIFINILPEILQDIKKFSNTLNSKNNN